MPLGARGPRAKTLDDATVQQQDQPRSAREAEPAAAGVAVCSLARLLGRLAARESLAESCDEKDEQDEEAG